MATTARMENSETTGRAGTETASTKSAEETRSERTRRERPGLLRVLDDAAPSEPADYLY